MNCTNYFPDFFVSKFTQEEAMLLDKLVSGYLDQKNIFHEPEIPASSIGTALFQKLLKICFFVTDFRKALVLVEIYYCCDAKPYVSSEFFRIKLDDQEYTDIAILMLFSHLQNQPIFKDVYKNSYPFLSANGKLVAELTYR